MYRRLSPFIILLLCLLIGMIALGSISHSTPPFTKGKAAEGLPYRFQQYTVRWGEITDFSPCGNTLYVLYDGKGILDCYSLDGTYLHSYAIALEEKGKARLYLQNETLHLKTGGFTFYTFQDGSFAETYTVTATELYSTVEHLTESDSSAGTTEYDLRHASIWHNTAGTSKEIIHRPNWMAVFQGNTMMLLGNVIFLALIALGCYTILKEENKS